MDQFRNDVIFFTAFPKDSLTDSVETLTLAIKTGRWRTKTILVTNDQGAEVGAPDDVQVNVYVKVRDGKWWPLKTAQGGLALANQVFPFSFEDIVEEIKVGVTPGTTLPERISIQVNAGREAS